MDESTSDREVLAVDSEFTDGLGKDSWRYHQLCGSASNPKHPVHKFGVGNKETLDCENTRKELLKFHKTFYKAFRMSLVVLSQGKMKSKKKHSFFLFP